MTTTRGAAWLALRSLLWTLLCPGTVAGLVPWLFFGIGQMPVRMAGVTALAGVAFATAGLALLVACVWEFATRGQGTLSPIDPPRRLVVRGPYRLVRNPMYLGVTAILLGESFLTGSPGLRVYAAVFFIVFNLFVVGYEEPRLRRRFGAEYEAYAARVGRWLP
jgi:protein-S-isoprenylcysteine O-methyltransferase Ste14